MAQAAVDLPDPLEKPTDSPVNTDELLSELAGSEIDRLLAEADAEHKPRPAAAAKPGAKPASEPAPTTPPAPPAETNPDISSQLDELFEAAKGGEVPAPAKTPPAAAAAPAAPAPVAASAPAAPEQADEAMRGTEKEALLEAAGFDAKAPGAAPPAAKSADGDPSPSERQALLKAAGFDSSEADEKGDDAAADSSPSDEPPPVGYEPPLPFYLKPLEWINAPLQALPRRTRDAMGKVGIITSINAVAVIVYVLFFRKH